MSTQPASTRNGALSHVRICDFTGQLAGAGATKFLAAFGAQVIRIEDPVRQGRWDILRGAPPFRDERRGIDLGGAFNNHNVEKLGITLNLQDAARPRAARAPRPHLRRRHRELRRRRDGAARVRLRAPARAQARRRLRLELRLRRERAVPPLQDLGPDRAGDLGPDVHLGAARPRARRLGLLVHGPHRRLLHGHRDPDGAPAPGAHRRRAVGRHVVHRGGRHADRSRDPRLDRQSAADAAPRVAARQPQRVAADGAARHLPGSRRGLLDRDRLPRRLPTGRAFARVVDRPFVRDARFADLAGRLAAQDALDDAVAAWTRELEASAAAARAGRAPAFRPPSSRAPRSASSTIPTPRPGACGPRSSIARWGGFASTDCRCTSRAPTGRSRAARRASASTTTRCSASCSGSRRTRSPRSAPTG